MIAPGSIIGIVGGGQLGRMLAVAAAQLGYKCHIFDPHERPCAADVAAGFTRAAYDDTAALAAFGQAVDIATYEFENLPVEPLRVLGDKLRPGTKSLAVAQDRAEEKAFIEATGARVAPWRSVSSFEDVEAAVAELGVPIVLKTRRYGYDGKGQAWIRSPEEAAAAWDAISHEPAVAEAGVSFAAEFSVIVARWADGRTTFWDSPDNAHREGILRTSTVPSGDLIAGQTAEARAAAASVAEALGHIGVLTVEFFASAHGPVVNEIAPRVHNSGHWTIEGAVTSQFEQHIRAVCDLPPGSTDLAAAAVAMDNLIGDEVHGWRDLLADPNAHVHIYGKGEARPGRKMGHVTRLTLK
ncbi:5-(carboxyamino)imidazole ribonucleotide synthase [Sphingomonas daechungensis]|uniref:N5-carboxyaminoimidazole ribonucleotide synthase n=1 Tax=Sphingomonas daechungensis TaxID=1176646 RepID=A0ABX6T3G5_9SPHN|nr:5-(carboxyamino)imidazole ribonucleotide synthase [Sphingomonas daechungensis]QNP43979.1 5-(carboxyamino)imidazole ribonucleotide synthase [Sphingomonas daechungensis]